MSLIVGIDPRTEHQGAVVASGSSTVILGPFNFRGRPTKTFCLYNQGPVTLSGAIVQVNPDPAGSEQRLPVPPGEAQTPPCPSMWINYDVASFVSLGAGQARGLVANDAYPWWRILGVNNQGTTTTVSGYANALSL